MAAAPNMSALPKHILTATALGNVSVLTQWIEDGGDPNARTIDGHTLPSVAAIFCRLDSMTVLVERGARVDVADGDGWTPLIEAVVFQPGIESNDDHRVRRRELVDLLLTA
jgi:ankyrin repeat protein